MKICLFWGPAASLAQDIGTNRANISNIATIFFIIIYLPTSFTTPPQLEGWWRHSLCFPSPLVYRHQEQPEEYDSLSTTQLMTRHLMRLPLRSQAQVLGVFDRDLVPVMADVLKDVGVERALVVHGSDGLDEITLTGSTYVTELKDGNLEDWVLEPADLGLELCNSEDLIGGTVQENALILMDILEGKDSGPRRDAARCARAGAATGSRARSRPSRRTCSRRSG